MRRSKRLLNFIILTLFIAAPSLAYANALADEESSLSIHVQLEACNRAFQIMKSASSFRPREALVREGDTEFVEYDLISQHVPVIRGILAKGAISDIQHEFPTSRHVEERIPGVHYDGHYRVRIQRKISTGEIFISVDREAYWLEMNQKGEAVPFSTSKTEVYEVGFVGGGNWEKYLDGSGILLRLSPRSQNRLAYSLSRNYTEIMSDLLSSDLNRALASHGLKVLSLEPNPVQSKGPFFYAAWDDLMFSRWNGGDFHLNIQLQPLKP